MSTLRNINLNLSLGQEIGVGINGDRARITKIEYHEKSGEISLGTTLGPRKALTFRLLPNVNKSVKDTMKDMASKYR